MCALRKIHIARFYIPDCKSFLILLQFEPMANQAVFGETKFHVGDTIRVHYKLIEKEKVAGKTKREVKEEVRERVQVFEGVVIGIKGEGDNKSFMVRRMGIGSIGIERIFPLISPWIKKISVKSKGKVRRAKLYFLREKSRKETDKILEATLVAAGQEKKIKLEETPPMNQNEQPVPQKVG